MTADVLILLLLAVVLAILVFGIPAYLRRRGAGRGAAAVPRDSSFEPGVVHAVPGARPDRAFRMFAVDVARGVKGLAFSRLHPDEVRRRYRIGPETPILWLSRSYGADAVNPTNLGALAHEVERFVSGKENSIVLVDGLEYLLVQAEPQQVMRFLESLADIASLHKSKVVLPVNLDVLREPIRGLMMKEIRVL